MKIIYVVKEGGVWEGAIVAYFTDKQEASKFAELNENYYIQPTKVYENYKELKEDKSQKNWLEFTLEMAIENLSEDLKRYKEGNTHIHAKVDSVTYVIFSRDIGTVLNNHKLPKVIYIDNEDFDWYYPNKKFTEKYLPKFEEACKNSINEYKHKKELLLKLKNDYKEITNKKNNKISPKNDDVRDK